MPKKVKLQFFRKPTKAERLAAQLLQLQIEQLQASTTIRRALKISLHDLQNVDKVRRELQGSTK